MTISTHAFKGLLARAKRDNQSDRREQEPELQNEVRVSQQLEQSRQLSVMDKVIEYLTNDASWSFQVDRERNIVLTGANSTDGYFRLVIDPNEDLGTMIVYVLCPIRVPEGNKRLAVAEFLTRANYGITIGNFEMDFRDGEVRYKGSVEYADGDLTTIMIDKLIQKCAGTMARYFCGLMKIIYADMDPAIVIGDIEPEQAGGNAIVEAIASPIAVQVEISNDEIPTSPVIQVLDEDEAKPVTPDVHAQEEDAPTPASSTDDEANEEM